MKKDVDFLIKFRRAFLQTRYMNDLERKTMEKIESTELTEKDIEEHMKLVDGFYMEFLDAYTLGELSKRFRRTFGSE